MLKHSNIVLEHNRNPYTMYLLCFTNCESLKRLIDAQSIHSVGTIKGKVLELLTYLVSRKEMRLWAGSWNTR